LKNQFRGKKQFLNRAKRLGYINAMSQVIFFLCIAPVIKRFSQKRKAEIFKEFDLDETGPPQQKVKRIRYANTDEGRSLLKQLSPDLIIVNGTRIISKKTLEAVPATFINIHTGITPAFRGVHGGYWAIANGKKDLFGTYYTLLWIQA
jgi:methionyl-tRNA formyltransferase